MKNIIKVIAIAAVAMSPAVIHGQLLMQQMNEDGVISTTTATGGDHWQLSGSIHDLSQFSGTGNTAAENPFGWANWVNYGSVEVVDGVWQGTATAVSPQMLTDTNAYSFDMGTYRYLEITIRKESPIGSGVVRFRKDGNSIATSGQIGNFAIANAAPADISNKQNTFILDMHAIAAWTGGNMTGLALQLHEGQGASVIGTTDYLYSVRLSDGISAIPEPTTYAAILGLVAVACIALRRRIK